MFNVEPYIERCIRSLEDQDIPQSEYELICINDGSPDNCRAVVGKLQEEFGNIILIDQENRGVSMARNAGIDRARGKYLLMVDPDDYLISKSIKSKLSLLIKQDIDIGYTGYIILNEQLLEEYRYDPGNEEHHVYTGIEFINKSKRGKSEIRDPHRSWAVFFKRVFLNSNSIRYLPDVPYLEDGELMARAMSLSEKLLCLESPFYLRTTRRGSATHSPLFYSDKARLGFLKAANNLNEFKNDPERTENQRIFINQYITHFVLLFIISHKFGNFIKDYKRIYNTLKKGSLAQMDPTGSSKAYKRIAVLYNNSLILMFLYWHLLMFFKSIKIRYNRALK